MAQYDVTTAAARLEFDTRMNNYNACCQIDDNHFINFWDGEVSGPTGGYTQIFTVNTTTWAVTTAAAILMFQTDNKPANNTSCVKMDANHVVAFWDGQTSGFGRGTVQVFEINTTTWTITTNNSDLDFYGSSLTGRSSSTQIDTNHFIVFFAGDSSDGFVQVITVNTTTWAITTSSSVLEFDTDDDDYNSCFKIDTNHFINFWKGQAGASKGGNSQVFTVNTTTWAVTTAGAKLIFSTTNNAAFNTCFQIDSNHFIDFYAGESNDGYAQVFTVNTTTWDVTTAAAVLEFETQQATHNDCYQVDSNHFINFWQDSSGDGKVQVFTVNTSTWEVTTAAGTLEFDTNDASYNSCFQIDSSHFINFWSGADTDGFVQVFTVVTELPVLAINVSDSITVSENVSITLFSNISTSDTIQISETISVVIIILPVDVFDIVQLTENITAQASLPDISVLDGITLTEFSNIEFVSLFNIYDNIIISESVEVSNPEGYADVFDEIELTEYIEIETFLNITVSDTLNISENVNMLHMSDISVFDIIDINENVLMNIVSFVNVLDNITVSENVSTEQVNEISVFDGITITESISFENFRFSPSIRRPVGIMHQISPIGNVK